MINTHSYNCGFSVINAYIQVINAVPNTTENLPPSGSIKVAFTKTAIKYVITKIIPIAIK